MGVLAEQQRATHVHVGDGSTDTEPNGEPDAGPNAEPHSGADTKPDDEPDAGTDAAPVRRWLAQLRQGGRGYLL